MSDNTKYMTVDFLHQYILRDSLDILIDNLVDKERSFDAVLLTKETLSFKERVSIDFALNNLLDVLRGIDKDTVVRDELSLSNERPLAIGRYVRDRARVMSFREVKGAQVLPEGESNDVGIIDLEKRINKLELDVGLQEQESFLNIKARLEDLEKCTDKKDPKHKYSFHVEGGIKFMDCPIGSFVWINAIDGKAGLGFKAINSYSAYEGGTALVYNLLNDDLVYPVRLIEEKNDPFSASEKHPFGLNRDGQKLKDLYREFWESPFNDFDYR